MIFIGMKWKKSQHLTVRLSKKQLDRILAILKEEGMTKSELVRLALADYMMKSN